MAVTRVTEVIGSSPSGWDDALSEALSRANRTLRNIEYLEIARQDARVIEGKITEFRVTVNIHFVLEE